MGLAAGLLTQGAFFAPFDLLQYDTKGTTLLAPLFAAAALARRIIPTETLQVDLGFFAAKTGRSQSHAGLVRRRPHQPI